MPTVFQPLFPDEIKLPAQDIQTLLDAYPAQKKTGIARLSYALDKRLYFLFKRGGLANVCLVTPERWESFTYENSLSWIRSAGDAYVKTIPLSPAGLRIAKLLIQSQNASEKSTPAKAEIAQKIAEIEAKRETALVRLEWKNASGAVLFQAEEETRFIFMSPEIILDETGSCKALCEWDEPECALTVFAPDLEKEAWQEYYLRRAFKQICERSLARFETLAGQALVESLTRLMNLSASRQSLDISIARGRLTENEIFTSPQQALYSYRRLLAEMFEHFSAVIGPRLYLSTLREVAAKLPATELNVVRRFELLSKGYLNE